MAAESSRDSSAAAALFQRAHQKMTMLARIDEQLVGLLDQRKKMQEELKTIQGMINEEFDRMTKMGFEVPMKVLEAGGGEDGRARAPRMSIPESAGAVA